MQTGRARLRKHVVTEQQHVTVPVQHEEVTLEREPITDTNVDAATNGPALSEEEHEGTLNEERVVVDKETVPVERVKLGTETHTEQQQVTEDVAHEEIELDENDTTHH
ncbi:YsnF/AvaK domain-containing protein [Curtobacterium sp. MCLR17_054]|uniref:YsnF/AvaK domain-containing protein n=1 Tax=Curtobacterium sp. MCLR17_054 TaxID=2175632 RepID=UPI0021ABE9C8